MPDRKFIEGKISLIEEYFYEMEDIVKFGEKEILKDNMKLRGAGKGFSANYG